MVAQLVLDTNVFAGVGIVGREWVLVMREGVAAGSSDPHVIWSLINEIAARAEANGNFVSLQSHTEFRALLEDYPAELGEDIPALAAKVLSVYPLPAPSGEHVPVR
jgi:hypothetical protein